MAYMDQATKAAKAPKIKAILAKYGVKGSLAVRHHSTLVLNIKSGKLDFIGNHNKTKATLYAPGDYHRDHEAKHSIQVNVYHTDRHYTGTVKKFFREVLDVMNDGNHNRSDIQTDYFDVGWYVDIKVGKWNKPYVLVA